MKITTDIQRFGVDPTCGCEGKGGHTHQEHFRCAPCPSCGQRIKGIYFVEHTEECKAAKRQR